MPTDPATLYHHLQALLVQAPQRETPITEKAQWAARVFAAVAELLPSDASIVRNNTAWMLDDHENRFAQAMESISGALLRALATAELRAPASATGAFLAAGQPFDAIIAVGTVLRRAASSVMIVDPYMDEKTLTDFALSADDQVTVRLLTDAHSRKASLLPAVTRWQQQHGTQRPLEARASAPRQLHDRVIVVDDREAWILTQSLNALAERAPATIQRASVEVEPLKLAAYLGLWGTASALT